MADVTVTLQLVKSCTPTDILVVMATWQACKYTLFLALNCILQKIVYKLTSLLYQDCFHIKDWAFF